MTDNEEGRIKKANQGYAAVGVSFFAIGIVFWAALQNVALGIPFVVLGIVFFTSGLTGAFTKNMKPKSDSEPEGDEPTP